MINDGSFITVSLVVKSGVVTAFLFYLTLESLRHTILFL